MANNRPMLELDYTLIKEHPSTLVSTRYTGDLGQATHTREPRVGENRAVDVVEREAEDFLRELHKDKFFANEVAFRERLERARLEIRGSSVEGVVYETQETGVVGGTWTQTPQELEFGIRRAWRNARKCIMRSCCEDLRLCDLRSVKRSNEMAVELVKAVTLAFNSGNITPTVFVFPPRTANSRGPMIWNDQLLSFAGYENEDGSVVGDSKNVQLTKDIVELGWVPPQFRSCWDVLPVVVMAEGDEPVFVELPASLRRLVKIRHPKYEAAFWKLDLKWVAFPALSRLGFDIGGVQYTAAPFIGWFMDTEIGVRGLADPLRYDVLPDIVEALYPDPDHSFEDLPKYEQLAKLSRAQIELNFAIYHSFLRDAITISDYLSASKKWARFDDEFEKKNGYRLPSDPYWLAPAQGSIIPAWYHGGTPIYHPKPLICQLVQDPVTAWKTEKSKWVPLATERPTRAELAIHTPGVEGTDEGVVQEESVPVVSGDVREPSLSVLDVEAHLNDDAAPEAPLSSNASQGDVESPQMESASLMDDFPRPSRAEPDSLASSWDSLADLAATRESSPPIGVDSFPPSVEANYLSSSWEVFGEVVARPEPDFSTTSEESAVKLDFIPLTRVDSRPLSTYVELGSSDDGDWELAAQQPEAGPSLSSHKHSSPKRTRSNSLSTIDEEEEQTEEVEEYEEYDEMEVEENLDYAQEEVEGAEVELEEDEEMRVEENPDNAQEAMQEAEAKVEEDGEMQVEENLDNAQEETQKAGVGTDEGGEMQMEENLEDAREETQQAEVEVDEEEETQMEVNLDNAQEETQMVEVEVEEHEEMQVEEDVDDAQEETQDAEVEEMPQGAHEEEEAHESEVDDEGEEIYHNGKNELSLAIWTVLTDDVHFPKSPFDVLGDSGRGIPIDTLTSENDNVGDTNSDESVENALSSSGVVVAEGTTSLLPQSADEQPPLLESNVTAEKTPAASEHPTDYLQQYDPTSVIKVVWPAVYIPTLHAYTGTLRGSNPFTLEDPIQVISSVFRRMHSHLLKPDMGDISPKRLMHSVSQGKPTLAPRNFEVDGLVVLDIGARSSSNGLESQPYASTSRDAVGPQPVSGYSASADNESSPTDGESDRPSNWDARDAWELATTVYIKTRALADALHDTILTAHPFNNLKTHLEDRNYTLPSAQAVWEAFQLMAVALHRWARKSTTRDKWRKVTSVVRSSSMTLIDMLLVYLTQLRARYGDP